MRIAIIGGGINGLFCAWKLGDSGHDVHLFEKDTILANTSSSSSKLLHGGIRYLENGQLSLVREALIDRHWWLNNASQFCKPINMIIPVYENSRRSSYTLYAGASMYNLLSYKYAVGPSKWISKEELISKCPEINDSKLKNGVSFYDVQMHEERLGKWVAKQSIDSGVKIFENAKIEHFSKDGSLYFEKDMAYDLIINAAGPWASYINDQNNIKTKYTLKLVRGSHLFINQKSKNYFLFQEKIGNRIVFIMPYLGDTLIGTTEVEQNINQEIACSNNEEKYLLDIYNSYFKEKISGMDIKKKISGLRPIICKKGKNLLNLSLSSRESVVEKTNKVITIYGGKWTSAPSLSKKVSSIIYT